MRVYKLRHFPKPSRAVAVSVAVSVAIFNCNRKFPVSIFPSHYPHPIRFRPGCRNPLGKFRIWSPIHMIRVFDRRIESNRIESKSNLMWLYLSLISYPIVAQKTSELCIFEFEAVKKRKTHSLLIADSEKKWISWTQQHPYAEELAWGSLSPRFLLTVAVAFPVIYIYFYQSCLLSLLSKSLCVCLMIPVLFWMFKMVLQVDWVWSLSVGLLRKPLVPPRTAVTLNPRISVSRSSEER